MKKSTVLILSFFLASILFEGYLPAKERAIKVKLRQSERVNAPVVAEVDLYSGSYALVIGIDHYTKGWPRLSGAVHDAQLVADVLREKGFQVTFMKDLNSRELKQAFEEFFIFKGETPQARLFVWFAGHGHTLDGEGFLIPADAPRPGAGAQFKFKALSMRRFGEFVRLAKSKHALAVFDSCFSGTIFDTQRTAPPAAVTIATTRPVRQFLSSGDSNQKVSDDGRFRKLFVRAIRGEERADANRDGYLTGSELGLFLTDRLTNLTQSRQTPRYGKLRDEDWDRGDFVFRLASNGATVSAPSSEVSHTTLSVSTNVTGARVLVDGRRVGETPLSDVEVSPGEHRIRVEKQGYDPYRKRIRLESGRSMSLYVDLSEARPRKARLFVETEPDDATVKILNIGPTFYQGMELDPGRYHVEVSATGYQAEKLWVDLSAGEDRNISMRLDPVVADRPAASGKAGRTFTNNLGMEFVYIKPGTFMMGSPSNEPKRDNDERQHRVTLTRGFYMQSTEVTQGQWKRVMGSNPSRFKNCGDNCPVEKVSWNDCQEFIRKLNRMEGGNKYRLPTEAEWEYACRAGTDTPFSFGGCLSTDQANYDGNYPMPGCSKGEYRKTTVRSASFPPNPWGLYDMHGNVWEWCQDWFGDYPSGSVSDPAGPSSGSYRVYRGGSWFNSARYCRSADRLRYAPGYRIDYLGFRLARAQ